MNAIKLQLPIKSYGRWSWLIEWGAYQRKTIYLFEFVIAVCFFFFLVHTLTIISLAYGSQTSARQPLLGDFWSFWSYAKIASTYSGKELYNLVAIHSRQVALGLSPDRQYPFLYPPTFIIYLWPLSLLPYKLGFFLWMGGTFSLFIWVVAATCTQRWLCLLGVMWAPVCTLNIGFGQSGFLSGALIIGGVRLADRKPILAGMLIGILSYKPELGILVPIAFAAAGLWTAFVTALATILGLAAITTIAFGWTIWSAWASMLPFDVEFVSEHSSMRYWPTVFANLHLAGFPLYVTIGTQILAAIVVGVLVALCFRRNVGRLAAASLLAGTFLAIPHASVYDMPMVTGAIVLFIEARLQTNPTFNILEIIIIIMALMFPTIIMIGFIHLPPIINLPVSSVPIIFLFGLIMLEDKREAVLSHKKYLRSASSEN